MAVFRSLIITLLLTYCLGVLASRWLVFRAFAIDGPTLVALVAVPVVQAAALAVWRRWSGRRRP